MKMNEVVTLIARTWDEDKNQWDETKRDVFCGIRSVGYGEFYASNATDYRPELKFVLADYLDYAEETLTEYNGVRYRILRTYRTGQELEMTVERAPAEEAENEKLYQA